MEDGEYEAKSQPVLRLASMPPDQMASKLAESHPMLQHVAPNMAPHIHSTAMRAIQFLGSRMPGTGNELIQDEKEAPSQAEKEKWLELHHVINDPASVLEHVKNNTLTGHHVEALQTVYPDLHQEMVAKIAEHLGNLKQKGQEVPYQKRLSLSLLTGQPLDSTMTPESMQAALMANRGATTETQGTNGKPKRASGPELNQLNKVNGMAQTPLQRRASGKA